MALIDVIKCDIIDGEFCYKFPSNDLRLGTQLVVYPSQTAFFVKGGGILDEFTAGTYTISTENIPLLNGIINLPFGGDSPFKADVWFINQISKLDLAWGTPHPIQLEDPKYNIIVPVRAHGQYGLKISNPRFFLESLIGNMTSFNAEKINQYFKGKLISSLNALLAQQIIREKVSVLDINMMLISMSTSIEEQLNTILGKYGISIVEFSIMSINVPEEDPSVIRLKKAKDLSAQLNINGRDVYQMQRSFDVLEKAASNEGIGGQMMGMGVGLGAGINVGNTMGEMASQMINTNPTQIPLPIQSPTYYLYINGAQVSGQTIQQIQSYIQQGVVNSETLVWTVGMSNWARLIDVPTLSSLVSPTVPPPINNL
jgi:membrane protease subunit (stomatin/prohibitin family)